MAIPAISGAIGSLAVKGLSSAVRQARSQVDRDGDGDDGGPKVSQRGQMMAQLQKLQQQDPAKFKQFMADEAAKLKDAAAQASGEDAKRLSNLADKFQQSASSGDLSAFQPKQQSQASNSQAAAAVQAYQKTRAQGGHHHHGGQGGGAVGQALEAVKSDLQAALG